MILGVSEYLRKGVINFNRKENATMNSINKILKLNFILFSAFLSLLLIDCSSYLDSKPEAKVLKDDIFGYYPNFQGYLDQCYFYLVDWNKNKLSVGQQIGGESIGIQSWLTSRASMTGDYWGLVEGRSCYNDFPGDGIGWWATGWGAIRVANQAIENIDLLVNPTSNEREWLLGQAHFFRALYHMEIWRAFGSIPYIGEVIVEDFNYSRFYEYNGKTNCQAVAEHMVDDLDMAIQYLPKEWPQDMDGIGRVTKGTAAAYKARVLLTAGSPLFNEFSGNGAVVNQEYMMRAAEAASAVLKLADEGIYSLTPFENYKDMFCKNDGTFPESDEIIFAKRVNIFGQSNFSNIGIGRIFIPDASIFGGTGVPETVTQNYVDKYEMIDGTKYLTAYDEEENLRWNGRDPRFRTAIFVDKDTAGISPETVLELFKDGKTRSGGNTLTPYIVHKYWSKGVNGKDGDWDNFYYHTPLMRLADVYLMYAEAIYASTGDPYSSYSDYSMSAFEAVNKVRNRAGMPDVDVTLSAYDGDFLKLVLNERAVELAFEGHFWFDQRRWKIKPDAVLYDLQFDEDYSYFSREPILNTVFEDRHWWLPFPSDVTQIANDFPQNPGW